MRSDECGRLFLAADMNFDGLVTISDVGSWLIFVFTLPARIVSTIAFNSPAIQRFFEMDCSTGTGWGGGLASLFLWPFIIVFCLVVFTGIFGGGSTR